MKKVTFEICREDEMLTIFVNDKCVFDGNFWDFDTPDDIVDLVEKLGHATTVTEVESSFDDAEEDEDE